MIKKNKCTSSKNTTFILLLLLVLFIATRDDIARLVSKYWVNPVMSNMVDNAKFYTWTISIIIFLYYAWSFVTERYASKDRYKTICYVSISVGLALIYSYYDHKQGWSNTPYRGWEFSPHIIWGFLVTYVGEIVLLIKRIYIKYCIDDKYERKRTEEEIDKKEKKYRKKKKKEKALIYEKPIEDSQEDLYKRENYSRVIADNISNNFHKEGAFVLGISGNWGYGKTSFLHLIGSYIKKKNVDIQFLFKPWLSSSIDTIVPDFLAQLAEELSPHVPRFQLKLNRYADAISDLNSDPVLKSALNLLLVGFSKSPEKQYQEIKDILLATKLKVLVLIDDTDRLAPDEILEVFKLVRNSANFPYLQFVITYDRDYILDSLKSDGISWRVSDPDKYMEKIFNVELSLTSYEYTTITNSLINTFNKRLGISSSHIFTLSTFLKSKTDKFPTNHILQTQRDVVRFANAFKINLDALMTSEPSFLLSDINIVDFLKIELIRYKFPNDYNHLLHRPQSVLKPSDDGIYYSYKPKGDGSRTEKSSVEDKTKTINNIFAKQDDLYNNIHFEHIEDDKLLAVCMSNLFPKERVVDNNSISMTRAFDQYFRYNFDDRNISISEVISLLQESSSLIQLETLLTYHREREKKPKEIQNMFNYITTFGSHSWDNSFITNPFYYKKVIKVIDAAILSKDKSLIKEVADGSSLLFDQRTYPNINYFIEVLELWDRILPYKVLPDETILNNFIYEENLKVKLGEPITDVDRNRVEEFLREADSLEQMSGLLYKALDPDNKIKGLLLDKQILRDIQLSYFKKYAEKRFVDRKLEQLYVYTADLEEGTRKYLWNEEASRIYRHLIDIDIQGYINQFFIYDKSYVYLLPKGYWKALFKNDADKVDRFLFDNSKDDIEGIEQARLVWNIYKDNNLNDINTHHLPYRTQARDEFFSILEQDYKAIKEVEEQLTPYIDTDRKYDDINSEELIRLREKLKSTSLSTQLKNDLINLINKLLEK